MHAPWFCVSQASSLGQNTLQQRCMLLPACLYRCLLTPRVVPRAQKTASAPLAAVAASVFMLSMLTATCCNLLSPAVSGGSVKSLRPEQHENKSLVTMHFF